MKNLIFFLFLLPIAISNCSKGCPPDERKGEVKLSDTSRAFDPYEGSEVLVFVNQNGAELKLGATEGRQTSTDKLCYKTTCTELKYGSPSSCAYYDAQSIRYYFNNQTNGVLVDLLFYTEVYDDKPSFYDAMRISLSYGIPSVYAAVVTDERSSGVEINALGWEYYLQKQEEINGFENVFFFEDAGLGIFYTKEQGLVGFKNNTNEWWLDRVE